MSSSSGRDGRGLLLSLACGEIVLAFLAARNLERETLPFYLAFYFGMAVFWIVACAVVLRDQSPRHGDPVLVFFVAVALRAVFLPAEPVLSDDVFRYVWDGRVQHEGIDPYLYAPQDSELAFLREKLPAIYSGINNKEIPTIYPPLLQAAFFLATAVSQSVLAMKAFFVLFDLALVYALIRLEPSRALIYAWSPLPVVEVAASGHNEPFAVFFLVAAFWAFAKKREASSMLLLAASGMAKLASFALAPAFARFVRCRALAAIPLAVFALALPYASAGGLAFRGLGEYVARWRSNDGLFHVLLALTGSLERAKAAAVFLFASVILVLVWKRVPPLRAAFWTLGALVLLSPVVHPWYLLWVAPFLVFFPHPAWLYLQAAVALSYHALYLASPGEPWQELAWIKVLEYGPFFLLLALRLAVHGRRRTFECGTMTKRGIEMPERSADWLRQGESDLRHARNALEDGDYDWAAFASHQAAEKAIKALFQKFHQEAWGHVLSILLANLPEEARLEASLIEKAKELDKHYIPARYPNGFPQGAPVDFYTMKEAQQAIANAEAIVEFCRDQIAR